MSLKPAFEVPATVLLREVDGEMVLLELDGEQYYGLDEVGARIVTRLTDQPFLEAMSALQGEYSVSPEVLQRDVMTLIDELVRAKLLIQVGDVPA